MTAFEKGIRRTIGELGARIAPEFPALSQDERTRLSWSRTIHSLAQVPEAYRSSYAALIRNTDHLPYTLLAPRVAIGTGRTKGALVWCDDGILCILAQVDSIIQAVRYPIENVSYIQTGSVLLQSWIKIRGMTTDNILMSTELRSNPVTDYLFAPLVERIRPSTTPVQGTELERQRRRFDYLCRSNFKLMNYARRSIISGERVVEIVLQPEFPFKVHSVLGRALFKTDHAAHITILTDMELILIEDGVGTRWANVQYGGIWHYIPLAKITRVSTADIPNDRMSLSIYLPGNDRIDVRFSLANRPQVVNLRRRLAKP